MGWEYNKYYRDKVRKKILPELEERYGPFTDEQRKALVKKIADEMNGGWLRAILWLLLIVSIFTIFGVFIMAVIVAIYELWYRKRKFNEFMSKLESDLKEGKVSAYL